MHGPLEWSAQISSPRSSMSLITSNLTMGVIAARWVCMYCYLLSSSHLRLATGSITSKHADKLWHQCCAAMHVLVLDVQGRYSESMFAVKNCPAGLWVVWSFCEAAWLATEMLRMSVRSSSLISPTDNLVLLFLHLWSRFLSIAVCRSKHQECPR